MDSVEEHVRRTVEAWPEHTQAQLDRLALLLCDDSHTEPIGADALAEMMEGDE